jgi:CheY-like chemotaxis protein
VKRRILIVEPNVEVRSLLELTVRRLGYEVVDPASECMHANVDAIILEPACAVGRSVVDSVDSDVPVICLSIYPREDGLEPDSSVAYLVKPSSITAIRDALAAVFTG